MPSAPAHPCPAPHCGRLVSGPGRCPAHRRGTNTQRGYSKDWSRYSRAWLDRFPWCGQRVDGAFHVEHSRCAAAGLRTLATHTDHVLSMKRGGEPFDPRNHQSLCASCNARKSVSTEGGFGR